ncbi:MAG: F0F1 ATP synthase subunit gamma [Candidatus Sungbacteria bacterium]|nr:F0F1 ATP synthase subunit gamma [Candidatus Sungbacteria bacterium]
MIRRNIFEETERLSVLRILIETYEGIAAMTIRRIRNSVLQNREFYAGLSDLFAEIKSAYAKDLRSLMVKRGIKQALADGAKAKSLSLIRRNGKTVYVLLSSNTGLYGEIIGKTFALFVKNIRWSDADCVIVGRVGRMLFESAMPQKKFSYFDFPDTHVSRADLEEITKFLHQYENVVVFHGAFRSFIDQHPALSRVSGDERLLGEEASGSVSYIFEPSLEDIMVFFESEIFASLLGQVFYESRLAKVASRLMVLDRASTNVDDALRRSFFKQRQAGHQLSNKKQINAMSGVALWG